MKAIFTISLKFPGLLFSLVLCNMIFINPLLPENGNIQSLELSFSPGIQVIISYLCLSVKME